MNPPPLLLGVNIDHVATLRQMRGTRYPDVIQAARVAEDAGADLITVHLREDRRHIQDRDVERLAESVQTRLNLELAVTPGMLAIAERTAPPDACLVPERRAELTTEGGLDVAGRLSEVAAAVARLRAVGTRVSLFVDPDHAQLEAAREAGAAVVELHTGAFAEAWGGSGTEAELERLREASRAAAALGLAVNAGHGLHYHNVADVAVLPEIRELNIGHAIVARAVFSGLAEAVAGMKRLLASARPPLPPAPPG